MKRIDLGWLLALVVALVACAPMLAQAGLPNSHDLPYHAFRVGEMNRSWSNAVFFPRWAEGTYYGYGSPLWHFYASMSYYITSVLMQFLGVTALEALRLLIGLSFVLMSTGMYGFLNGQVGRVAGILGAVAYVYSPYALYTVPYVRGAYPELLALGVFAWGMWRMGAVLKNPSGMNLAGATLCQYALLISHNLMGAVLSALTFGWVLWQGVAILITLRGNWRALRAPLVGIIAWSLGVGCAAYFWLPVLLETDTVYLENLAGVALLDYHNFFVPLGALFAPMPLNDLGALNSLRLVTVFGLAHWALAAVGLVGVAYFIARAVRDGRRDDRILRQGVFFAIAGAAFVFLITPQSAFLWDGIPYLRFIQFPWRLLGGVAFSFAFLVGMNALWIDRLPNPLRQGVVAGVVAVVVLSSAPAFTVPEWTNRDFDTSITALHANEVAGIQRGTTFTDEYRPRSVYTLPTQNDRLLEDYADGYPVNKANVPDDITAEVLINNPLWLEWRVTSERDFTFEVLNFYWEGWTSYVNGVETPVRPSPTHGFITLDLPAGTHNVRVVLGPTPARLWGGVISGLSLLAMLALVVLRLGKALAQGRVVSAPTPREQLGYGAGVGLAVAVCAIAFAPSGIFWRNSPVGEAPAQLSASYAMDDVARLIGYDINGTTFKRGDTVEVTLYWLPLRESEVDFSSFLHIGAEDAPPYAQQDKSHPAERPISQWWKPTGYLSDTYSITLPADMPLGEHSVWVGWYTCQFAPDDCGNGYRPPITDADGAPVGDRIPLAVITVGG
jgi:hypothetical protein